MYDNDQMTDSPELRELRDCLSGVAVPGPPPLEAITARGRQRRRRRLTIVSRLSVGGITGACVVALSVSGALSPAAKQLRTIRTPSFTLVSYTDGTAKLTLNPGELLNPTELQSDFAKYGIPAKVTIGSYCTSDPEPTGFLQAVSGPGPGTSQSGSGQQPTITIDPSKIPAGTELTVGDFHLATGEQQANFSLMNSSSYTCTSTPPDMSQPDTSNQDFGVLYGGPGPSGS
jgi:hypothetical protein